MCDLCSEEDGKRAKAKDDMRTWAGHLESLAGLYRQLANGGLKPHTNEAKIVGAKARALVRHLVDEWI